MKQRQKRNARKSLTFNKVEKEEEEEDKRVHVVVVAAYISLEYDLTSMIMQKSGENAL